MATGILQRAPAPAGSHEAACYWGDAQRALALTRILAGPLAAGDGCAVVLDDRGRDAFVRSGGAQVAQALDEGRLLIAAAADVPGPLAFWDEVAAGFEARGVRLRQLVAESRPRPWGAGTGAGADLQLALEEFLPGSGASGVCLVDLEHASAHGLLRTLDRHRASDRPEAVLPLVCAALGAIEERLPLAELAAGACAWMTGAPLIAIALPEDTGWTVVGLEEGAPLTATRQRALAEVASGTAAGTSQRILDVPGGEGALAIVGREPQEPGVLEVVVAMLGAGLSRLALSDRNARLARGARDRELLLRGVAELADGQPAEVGRLLAGHVGGGVRVTDRDGTVVADVPAAKPGDRQVLPLDDDGIPGGRVVVTCDRPLDDEERRTVRGLAVAAIRLQPSRGDRGAIGGLLTLALLSAPETAEAEVRRCAARLRIDLGQPVRVALAVAESPADQPALEELATALRARHPLVAGWGSGIAALLPPGSPETVTAGWPRHGGLRVAVGEPGTWPGGVQRSLQQARWLSDLQRDGSALCAVPPVVVFESAGFLSDLAGLTGGERVLPFMRRALGPLLGDDRCGGELLDTLHAYLISGGSPNQAGQLLGLHPSSVKYRLKVIRSLLGRDPLQDADVRFELELAVRLAIALRNLEPST